MFEPIPALEEILQQSHLHFQHDTGFYTEQGGITYMGDAIWVHGTQVMQHLVIFPKDDQYYVFIHDEDGNLVLDARIEQNREWCYQLMSYVQRHLGHCYPGLRHSPYLVNRYH